MDTKVNIFHKLKNELGYSCVSNQYIEMSVRLFEKQKGDRDYNTLSNEVGLVLTCLGEDTRTRISRNYIVNLHKSLESFLIDFKDLVGSPTYKKSFNPDETNRLEWTLNNCFGTLSDDIKQLYRICNYYRLVRNGSVHYSEKLDKELKDAYSLLKNIDKDLKGKLSAPNVFECISFDDQVLFSRAIQKICEQIFYQSNYDWNRIIENNKETFRIVAGSVWDAQDKRFKKIMAYLTHQYPIREENKKTVQQAVNDLLR